MSGQPLNSNDFSYLGKLLSKQTYKDKDGNLYLTRQEVCCVLGIGESCFHGVMQKRCNFPLKAFYNGKRDYYRLSEVLAFQESQTKRQ